MTKQEIYQKLNSENHCVLSTVSIDNTPESAFVGFSINKNLEVTIGTSKKSRKYNNIKNNRIVSLVFLFDEQQTVQYEGVAREIVDIDEYRKITKHHFSRQPGAKKYENDPEQTYLVVTPKWIRLSTSGPEVIGELRQFS